MDSNGTSSPAPEVDMSSDISAATGVMYSNNITRSPYPIPSTPQLLLTTRISNNTSSSGSLAADDADAVRQRLMPRYWEFCEMYGTIIYLWARRVWSSKGTGELNTLLRSKNERDMAEAVIQLHIYFRELMDFRPRTKVHPNRVPMLRPFCQVLAKPEMFSERSLWARLIDEHTGFSISDIAEGLPEVPQAGESDGEEVDGPVIILSPDPSLRSPGGRRDPVATPVDISSPDASPPSPLSRRGSDAEIGARALDPATYTSPAPEVPLRATENLRQGPPVAGESSQLTRRARPIAPVGNSIPVPTSRSISPAPTLAQSVSPLLALSHASEAEDFLFALANEDASLNRMFETWEGDIFRQTEPSLIPAQVQSSTDLVTQGRQRLQEIATLDPPLSQLTSDFTPIFRDPPNASSEAEEVALKHLEAECRIFYHGYPNTRWGTIRARALEYHDAGFTIFPAPLGAPHSRQDAIEMIDAREFRSALTRGPFLSPVQFTARPSNTNRASASGSGRVHTLLPSTQAPANTNAPPSSPTPSTRATASINARTSSPAPTIPARRASIASLDLRIMPGIFLVVVAARANIIDEDAIQIHQHLNLGHNHASPVLPSTWTTPWEPIMGDDEHAARELYERLYPRSRTNKLGTRGNANLNAIAANPEPNTRVSRRLSDTWSWNFPWAGDNAGSDTIPAQADPRTSSTTVQSTRFNFDDSFDFSFAAQTPFENPNTGLTAGSLRRSPSPVRAIHRAANAEADADAGGIDLFPLEPEDSLPDRQEMRGPIVSTRMPNGDTRYLSAGAARVGGTMGRERMWAIADERANLASAALRSRGGGTEVAPAPAREELRSLPPAGERARNQGLDPRVREQQAIDAAMNFLTNPRYWSDNESGSGSRSI